MTRRKPERFIVKPQPPNPANIERKLRRIRQEIQTICDGIDAYLEARASIKPAKDLFS